MERGERLTRSRKQKPRRYQDGWDLEGSDLDLPEVNRDRHTPTRILSSASIPLDKEFRCIASPSNNAERFSCQSFTSSSIRDLAWQHQILAQCDVMPAHFALRACLSLCRTMAAARLGCRTSSRPCPFSSRLPPTRSTQRPATGQRGSQGWQQGSAGPGTEMQRTTCRRASVRPQNGSTGPGRG